MNDSSQDSPLQILLVEDNLTDVLLLEDALEEVNFEKIVLTHAKRLDEALRLLPAKHFDAVLLDLGLPDSQGLETFARMQREYPAVPILVLSGLHDEKLALTAVQDGAQDYLVKGNISSNTLARAIRYGIERKRTTEKLISSELGYRRLFETAQNGIFILDAETCQIADANIFLEDLLGYPTSDFVGKRLWEITPFRYKEASEAAFRTLREKSYIRYDDLPLATRDGRQINVEFISNVYEVDGREVIQCNIRDITERKKAERAVQESHRFLQATLDALASHIAVLDQDGKIIAVNKAWQQFSEENDGSATTCGIGASYFDVCDAALGPWAEDAPLVARGIRAAMTGEQKDFCIEYPCHSATEKRWFNVRVTSFGSEYPDRIVVAHENITERKLAENALRDSEVRFQSIVANTPGVVYQYVINTDGTVEIPFVNEACRELFEMEPEEIQEAANFPLNFIYPEDLAECQRGAVESADTLTPWNWEGRIQLRSGKVKWVQAASRPQRLPNGSTLWDGLMVDVSARKVAQQERDRFFTLSLDMLGIVDMDGYLKRVNPAFIETLGFSEEELMARSFRELVHPDDRAALHIAVDNLSKGIPLNDLVNRYRAKNGSWRWLEWRSVAIPEEGLIYAAARDITERKEAESSLRRMRDELEINVIERTTDLRVTNEHLQLEMAERERTARDLRAAQEMLQLVLDSIPQAIFWKDIDCVYLGCNYRLALDAGYLTPEEVIGEDGCDMPWAKHAPFQQSDDREVMETDVPKIGVEEFYISSDGRPMWFRTNRVPLHDSQGKVIGILGSYEDITLQKEVEAAIHQARDEADAANLAKSEFLSRMSHELRTPLNAILGFGQILELRNASADPRQIDNIQQILKAGRHLLDLINEVLDIARIEAGYLSFLPEPVSVAHTVHEVLSLMQSLASSRDIQLINEVDVRGDVLYVLADQQRMKQVLLNLLSNAVKYNCEGGKVVVSTRVISSAADVEEAQGVRKLRLSVRDTGLGLKPTDISRLFVPFERLEAFRTQIEGTGIGLSLCKRLMEAMDGQIGVESDFGQGSTFWFELPLTEAPPKDHINRTVEDVDTYQKLVPLGMAVERPCTILYIEDNLANITLIEHILCELYSHMNFLPAMQGSLGLELAVQHCPNLILLDVNLPDIMGDEVLNRLKANPATREIPVVVLSADATARQIDRMLHAGASHYLTKPLDIEQFYSVLEETLTLQ
ncbi:MAG TPA: PAS domain S-box protein [Abditibacteriaceae bacterium]|jgi:PAS domain S-box-containing protein